MLKELAITAALINHVRKFLGEDGAEFFSSMMRKHGRYDPVFMDHEVGIPHPVHLREGMQVRNAMRRHSDCTGWGAHDYDGTWVVVVGLCMRPVLPPMPVTVQVWSGEHDGQQ